MSRIGKLTVPSEVREVSSEVEALRVLREAQEAGKRGHYIRHRRDSFSVVLFKGGSDAKTKD